MYTVDASVWVNAFDQREPGHETSRRFLEAVQAHAVPVVLPNLLCVEVAGAISRTRNEPARAQEFATAVARLPNVTLLPLDEDLVEQARDLAARNGLRGADAVYAAVAVHAACTVVSLDQEHLTRLTVVVPACTPAAALTEVEARLADELPPPEADAVEDAQGRDAGDDSEATPAPRAEAGAAAEAAAEEPEAAAEEPDTAAEEPDAPVEGPDASAERG